MALELFSLQGRVALVTGGNGGIGKGIALALRDAGAKVAVTGRAPEKNATAASDFGQEAVFPLDVAGEPAVEQTIREVVARFGRLDILVNNAGVARGGALVEMERADWDEVIGVDLTGAFLCAKHAARAMGASGGGKIINVGSMYSLFGPPSLVSYAAAKSGLLGLTRALAVELAPRNIQVNAILPGWFPTGMTGELPRTRLGEEIRRRTPAGRWGTMDDLAGAAVFLASAASDFITGVALPVDGGYAVSDRLQHP
jgi:2-deoxy-D-gluconate 3-dehydrogenase